MTIKKSLPPVVDTSENLLASTKLIKDGQIAKIIGNAKYKVGTGNKTFADLTYAEGGSSLPPGGDRLDVLVKNSATDGDVAWAELDLSEYVDTNELQDAIANVKSVTVNPTPITNKVLIRSIDVSKNLNKTIEIPIHPDESCKFIIEGSSYNKLASAGLTGYVFINSTNPAMSLYTIKQSTATTVAATTTALTASTSSVPVIVINSTANVQDVRTTEILYSPNNLLAINQEYYNNVSTPQFLNKYLSNVVVNNITKLCISIPNCAFAIDHAVINIYKEQEIVPVTLHTYKEVYKVDSVGIAQTFSTRLNINRDIETFTIETPEPAQISIDINGFILDGFSKTKFELQISRFGVSVSGIAATIPGYTKPSSINIFTTAVFNSFLVISQKVETHAVSINPDMINGLDISYINGNVSIAPGNIELGNNLYYSPNTITKSLERLFDSQLEIFANTDIHIYAYIDHNLGLSFKALHTAPLYDRFTNKYDNDLAIPTSMGKYYIHPEVTYRAIGKLEYVNDRFVVTVPTYKSDYDFNIQIIDDSIKKCNDIKDIADDSSFTSPKDIWDIISSNGIKGEKFTTTSTAEYPLTYCPTEDANSYFVILGRLFLFPDDDYKIIDNKFVLSEIPPIGVTLHIRCLQTGFISDSPNKQTQLASNMYLYSSMPGGL